jgi:flagellar protein FliS
MSYAQSYRDISVLSASPGQLVVMLYDNLLVGLRRTRMAMEAGNVELRGQNLAKCRDIVAELLSTLDHAQGGEVAANLSALYAFFLTELLDIGRTGDVERLDRVTGCVQELRDAFSQIASSGVPRAAGA